MLAAFVIFIALNAAVVFLEPRLLWMCADDYLLTPAKLAVYPYSPKPDVVFLGSSVVLMGLDPGVVQQQLSRGPHQDLHALNLAVAHGLLDFNYLVLKNVIKARKKPRVMVYGITMVDLASRHGVNNVRLAYTSSFTGLGDYWLFGGDTVESRLAFLTGCLLPIYRDRDVLRDSFKIAFHLDPPSSKIKDVFPLAEKHLLPGGFCPLVVHTDRHFPAEDEKRPFVYDQWSIDLWNRMLTLAAKRGITVVVAAMPVAEKSKSFYTPEERRKYITLLRGISEHHGVQFLDFYTDSSSYFSDVQFSDESHMNRGGAEHLTQLIIDQSLSKYFPPKTNMADFFRASLSDLKTPDAMAAGSTGTGSVTFRNDSGSTWPVHGEKSVHVSYHWLDEQGGMLEYDGARTGIAGEVQPGGTRTARFQIEAPVRSGNYQLAVDLVYEHVGWFKAAISRRVIVSPAEETPSTR